MVEFAFRDFFRRKDDEIAQLRSENGRLLAQLHAGHWPNAGTGESPVRPPSKSIPKAWSHDGEQRHEQRRSPSPATPNMQAPPIPAMPMLRVDSYEGDEGNEKQKEKSNSIS